MEPNRELTRKESNMAISNYLKMNYGELGKEIEKQNRKIKAAQETIKLLRKLQIAESANSEKRKTELAATSSIQTAEKRF